MTKRKPLARSITVKIPDNDNPVLNFDIDFSSHWFTIITGPNGSGKSAVLKKIRDLFSDKTILYNPKRNSLRKQLAQAINDLEVGNRKKNNLLADLNKGWEDTNSIQYPSFQETIVAEFRERQSKNNDKSPILILAEIRDEYSNLLKEIFPNYDAIDWNVVNMGPIFKIRKHGKYELNVEQLSTGEQEVLSLVFSINSVKENCEILLIDEPELHLNWALERNLFSYLKQFSKNNRIQVIVATHSRVIFDSKFKDDCLYLYFDANKNITVKTDAPDDVRKQIAGEAINMLVSSGNFKNIYVEDEIHKTVTARLTELLNIKFNVNPIVAGNRSSVISFYERAKKNPNSPAFKNCFFIVDGDNGPDKYPEDDKYIHLGKNKCMETYFLNFKYLSKITNKSEEMIKRKFRHLANRIKKNKSKHDFLFLGEISTKHLTPKLISQFDPKLIWKQFYSFLGYKEEEEFIDKYLHYLVSDKKRLKSVFDSKFIKFFEV